MMAGPGPQAKWPVARRVSLLPRVAPPGEFAQADGGGGQDRAVPGVRWAVSSAAASAREWLDFGTVTSIMAPPERAADEPAIPFHYVTH